MSLERWLDAVKPRKRQDRPFAYCNHVVPSDLLAGTKGAKLTGRDVSVLGKLAMRMWRYLLECRGWSNRWLEWNDCRDDHGMTARQARTALDRLVECELVFRKTTRAKLDTQWVSRSVLRVHGAIDPAPKGELLWVPSNVAAWLREPGRGRGGARVGAGRPAWCGDIKLPPQPRKAKSKPSFSEKPPTTVREVTKSKTSVSSLLSSPCSSSSSKKNPAAEPAGAFGPVKGEQPEWNSFEAAYRWARQQEHRLTTTVWLRDEHGAQLTIPPEVLARRLSRYLLPEHRERYVQHRLAELARARELA